MSDVAVDAERAVLGAILLGGEDTLRPMVGGLKPEHFGWPLHAEIYAAMAACFERGEQIDRLTVAARLAEMGRPELEMRAAVEELAACPPFTGNARSYGRIVIRESNWRARRRLALEQLEACDARDEGAYQATLASNVVPIRSAS